MSEMTARILGSSVLRKQIVAVTGLAMVGFVVAHLTGNLLIYLGPEVFNAYGEKLADMSEVLWIMRIGLIAAVLLHIYFTVQLVLENRRARPVQYYQVENHGDRKWATRTMIYSGSLIVIFIIIHLLDFTFGDKTGPKSVVSGYNNDESLGLFGLVWNSYNNDVWGIARVGFYVLAVTAVGLHLSHAIQSVFQTFGFNHERYTPWIKRISLAIGILIAIGFASIPILSLLAPEPFGV